MSRTERARSHYKCFTLRIKHTFLGFTTDVGTRHCTIVFKVFLHRVGEGKKRQVPGNNIARLQRIVTITLLHGLLQCVR